MSADLGHGEQALFNGTCLCGEICFEVLSEPVMFVDQLDHNDFSVIDDHHCQLNFQNINMPLFELQEIHRNGLHDKSRLPFQRTSTSSHHHH